MSKFVSAGRSLAERHTPIRFIFSTTALVLILAAFAPGLSAQQSQLQNLNGDCGADYLGQTWNCTAGEIAISQVTGLQIEGDPDYCVIGQPITILTANVEYSINTQDRNDLTMYLGDQEGTDPRLFAGPGQSCSAFSVPGPFNPTPDANNPWGDNDGDACGDLAFSVTAASRPFTNVPINCQDNDDDGFADLQVLLTWDQNDKAICGQGPGQTFPTNGGTRSKCDYSLRNTLLPVVDPATLTIIKNTIGGDDAFGFSWGSTNNSAANFSLDTSAGPNTAQTSIQIVQGLGDTDFQVAEILTGQQESAGWTFVSAQCVDQDGASIGTPANIGSFHAIANMTIDSGDEVTCTFTNAAPASLTVVKNSVGGTNVFPFVTNVPGLGTPAELGNVFQLNTAPTGTAQITKSGIPITDPVNGDNYTITEVVPGEYKLASASCDNGTSTQTETLPVNLKPGENVTCTFTDTLNGSLTIVKNAIGGTDRGFDFESNLPGGNFSISTSNGTGSQSYSGALQPGTYTVREIVPIGWDLLTGPTEFFCAETGGTNNSTVDPATGTATITIEIGETVSCTFTNQQRAQLQITKSTDPSGGTGFDFTSDVPISGWASFTLDHGQGLFSSLVVPGTYVITEADPTPNGFDLTAITCVDLDGNPVDSVSDLPNRQVTVNLDPGDVFLCEFRNTQRGSVTLVKSVTADGPTNTTFTFTSPQLGTIVLGPVSAGTPSQQTQTNVPPGSYQIQEADPTGDGWELIGVTCTGETYPGVVNPATFTVNPGEDVTCTFTNAPIGSSTVIKNSVGGDGQFQFAWGTLGNPAIPEGASEFFGLLTSGGTVAQDFSFEMLIDVPYELTEVSNPAPVGPYNQEWNKTNVGCADPTNDSTVPGVNGGDATIVADSLETVTCTFTNTLDGTLVIRKETVPDGVDQAFTFTGEAAGAIRDFSSFGEELFVTGAPGATYSSTETVPVGWQLTDISCTGATNSTVTIGSTSDFVAGDTSVDVDLAAGETVICTFTNTRQGSITINKEAIGADGVFAFSSAQLGSFNIDTAVDTNRDFPLLSPGAYSIAEIVPPGWDLSNISCSGATNSSITIGGSGGFDPGDEGVVIDLAAGENVACTFTNTLQVPAIELVKTGTLNDDDGTAGVSAGDTISYAFTVTNTGNVTLTNVTLADTVGGVTINGGPIASLAPAAVDNTTFTGSYTLTQVDVDAGTFTNTATATGNPPSGPPVMDPDSDTQTLAPSAAIELVKTGTLNDDDGTAGVSAGDTISYAFTVTNTGNVTLTNVTLADTVGGVTINGGPIASLAPAAVDNTTFTGSYTLTQVDVDAGTFTNTATATGNPPSGPPVMDPDSDTQTLAPSAAIELVKTGTLNDDDGTAGVSAGDTISYAFTVTNTGNVTLTNVTLADTVGGVTINGGPIASLAPAAVDNTTFTGSYTLTQVDVDAGTFTNTATATGNPPSGPPVTDPDSDTQTLAPSAAIDLVKTGTLNDDDGTAGVSAGDTISYAFTVTNTGNVTLTNVTLADTVGGVTINGGPIASLAPAAVDSTTFTGSYTITQGDIDAGSFTNTATAGGDCPQSPACATDTDTDTQQLVPPRPPGEPQAIPVNNPWAILLLTLMVLALGWYFRPPMRRNF